MDDHGADGEFTSLQRFTGVPNLPNTLGEKGRWRRFLEWAMPWLKQKWTMGEAVLEARVLQEQATARRMMAEASQAEVKVTRDALETLAIARAIEAQKLAEAEVQLASEEELEAEIAAFVNKLQELGWKHGSEFQFSVETGGKSPKAFVTLNQGHTSLVFSGGELSRVEVVLRDKADSAASRERDPAVVPPTGEE